MSATSFRSRVTLAVAPWSILILVLACANSSAAQPIDYPTRPVRVILPQGPGSTTDLLGRIVFTHTSERLGKQLVVDNRPGAGGTLGMEIAARARPDGYTLVGVAASMLAITPHIYRKLPYDPLRDFVPVGLYEALGSAQLRKLFFELGEEPAPGSPEDFGTLIRGGPDAISAPSF